MRSPQLIRILALALALVPYALFGQPNRSAAAKDHRKLIDQYCSDCHDASARKAGVDLESVDLANIGKDARLWEKVVHKIRTGDMPPPVETCQGPSPSGNFLNNTLGACELACGPKET